MGSFLSILEKKIQTQTKSIHPSSFTRYLTRNPGRCSDTRRTTSPRSNASMGYCRVNVCFMRFLCLQTTTKPITMSHTVKIEWTVNIFRALCLCHTFPLKSHHQHHRRSAHNTPFTISHSTLSRRWWHL